MLRLTQPHEDNILTPKTCTPTLTSHSQDRRPADSTAIPAGSLFTQLHLPPQLSPAQQVPAHPPGLWTKGQESVGVGLLEELKL